MNRKHLTLVATLTAVLLTGYALLHSPKVAAAVRAALVEVVLPSQPFFRSVSVGSGASGLVTLGPTSGTLGITNITFTNYNSTVQNLEVFTPTFATGGCGIGGSNVIEVSDSIFLSLQPSSTMTLTYPSPLVLSNTPGPTCLGASDFTGGSVYMAVSGFVN